MKHIPHFSTYTRTKNQRKTESIGQIFLLFLRLGLTSFGGPVAHLGYFHDEFVNRRRWLNERNYADLVALCQFLPGPTSSQVGIALGLLRQGYCGALAAWIGFTLPSTIALIIFALGITGHSTTLPGTLLHSLSVVAVAVVAQAVWGMAQKLCTDKPRITIMLLAACIALLVPAAIGQPAIIAAAGVAGLFLFRPTAGKQLDQLPISISYRVGIASLTLFFILLFGLPLFEVLYPHQTIAVISAFFSTGALAFGGGHVMLPLLQTTVVAPGWVSNDAFLAGYGAVQAVPGPLFSFAAFLGASMNSAPTGWVGGMICLLAIFAPSFLLVTGIMPFWERLRRSVRTQAALMGVNAAVVGLLLAALYHPVWTSAIHQSRDFVMALAAFIALMYWKLPSWLVVLGCGVVGGVMSFAV